MLERMRCMVGFRKKSPPAMAPADLSQVDMISVVALAARRALATLEFRFYVALTEQLTHVGASRVRSRLPSTVGKFFALPACYAESPG